MSKKIDSGNKNTLKYLAGLTFIAIVSAGILLPDSALDKSGKKINADNSVKGTEQSKSVKASNKEDVEIADLKMYTSPYLRRFTELTKEFHAEQGLLIGAKVRSFPLFREGLIETPRDVIWMPHGQYLAKYLNDNGAKYKKVDIEMEQETVLWVKGTWAERFHLKDGSVAKWKDLALLAEKKELKFIMSNPATSISGYSVLANVDAKDPNLKERLFKGLVSLSGNDGMMSLQLHKNPDADGFFMDEVLGDYLKGENMIPDNFIKIHLAGKKVNTNFQMFAKTGLNNMIVKKWVDYIRANEDKIEQSLGLKIVNPNKAYIGSAYDDVRASDNSIDDFLYKYGPNIHNIVLIDSSKMLNNNRVKSILSNVFGELSTKELNGYPWSSYKQGDSLSLLEWKGDDSKPLLVEMGKGGSNSLIAEWFNTSGKLEGNNIYNGINHAMDLIDSTALVNSETRFQILVVTGDKDGSDQEFADFLEALRKRLGQTNISKMPRINSLLIGGLEANHFYSIGGLTGGMIRSTPLTEKNIKRAIIQMRHLY